jgi:hypothetical protein
VLEPVYIASVEERLSLDREGLCLRIDEGLVHTLSFVVSGIFLACLLFESFALVERIV